MASLVNFIAFQTAWFACILDAKLGVGWLGVAAVGVVVVLETALVTRRARHLAFLMLVGLLGTAIESTMVSIGAYGFRNPSPIPWLCPLWISAMWVNFATTVEGCLAWLRHHRAWASLLGLLGGPVSYWGGQRMGGMEFHWGTVPTLLVIGLVWAVATPLVFWLSTLPVFDGGERLW
ncbi:hypothetical protein Pan216_42440 [Planctomycetes bacterium Pan216]|uniref:DUF2878 domain-containing protein n=1 Tax=Kolteria novifilia TaxID=2527975 RepID=A0A518B8Q8_9BACT|nr:hypothetical protein Pan216_42440 [Planctomycetes bacterium Pan216]